MDRVTRIASLPIRDISSGEDCGVAQNILFNTKGALAFLELTKKGLGPAEILAISDVVGIGDDYLLIKEKSDIKKISLLDDEKRSELSDSYVLIGTEVIEVTGNKMGKIVDLEVDKSGEFSKLILEDGKEIEKAKIRSICEAAVFVDCSGSVTEEDKDTSGIIEGTVEETTAGTEEIEETELGKLSVGLIVSKDIVSDDGLFEIKAGSVITEEIIDEASKHDALIAIALYTE